MFFSVLQVLFFELLIKRARKVHLESPENAPRASVASRVRKLFPSRLCPWCACFLLLVVVLLVGGGGISSVMGLDCCWHLVLFLVVTDAVAHVELVASNVVRAHGLTLRSVLRAEASRLGCRSRHMLVTPAIIVAGIPRPQVRNVACLVMLFLAVSLPICADALKWTPSVAQPSSHIFRLHGYAVFESCARVVPLSLLFPVSSSCSVLLSSTVLTRSNVETTAARAIHGTSDGA